MTTRNGHLAAIQEHFLRVLPRIEMHARAHFRHVFCPGRREDAIAEVVAISWKWFLQLARQDKNPDKLLSPMTTFAIRHVRAGRHLCGQEASKDALSAVAHRKHEFGTQTISTFTSAERDTSALDALAGNLVTPPPEQAAFRIDYPQWLSMLGKRKAQIATDMAMGFATNELAAMHGVSPARISQLRKELHTSWHLFAEGECP